jgi:ABC-type Mn2+/Zn2+ transport system permease subunit
LPSSTEFWVTLGAFLAGLGLAGAMAWLERRPRLSLDPRIVPTTPLMFAGVIAAVLALVHLLNIEGIHTGR